MFVPGRHVLHQAIQLTNSRALDGHAREIREWSPHPGHSGAKSAVGAKLARPFTLISFARQLQLAMRYQQKNSEFHLLPVAIGKLIEFARYPRDRLLVALLAYTGLRRAEIRDLRVGDVRADVREIWVRNGKGGKQRVVFYPPALDELVAAQCRARRRGALFPGRGGRPLSLRAINLIVARVGKAAGIKNPNPRYKNVSPHLLRHSLARNWKRAGGSLESLQKILGHTSLKTTLDLYGTESLVDTKVNYGRVARELVASRDGG